MRILFVGDVVGRSGRVVVYDRLPGLIRDWKLDLVADEQDAHGSTPPQIDHLALG